MTGSRATAEPSIYSVIERHRRALKVESGYAKHAAPQSIKLFLDAARKAERALARHIEWLSDLYDRRNAEIAAGTWPANTQAEQASTEDGGS